VHESAKAARTEPAVLSLLCLGALLPCFAELAEQDGSVRGIVEGLHGSIAFLIPGGPSATLRFADGRVSWEAGRGRGAAVILAFLSHRHLNAFFQGKKWAAPLPVWGAWRVGLLARFSKLAERLEAVLNGAPSVLESSEGRRLHARLSLMVAVLGLRPLIEGDPPTRDIARALPRGLASFTIAGEPRATGWFDHGPNQAGWSEPPRRPEVCIEFKDIDTAYGALREEIDTLAAVGSGRIRVDGLVPLADGLNAVMERLQDYLRP
jgi:hypothetical protein